MTSVPTVIAKRKDFFHISGFSNASQEVKTSLKNICYTSDKIWFEKKYQASKEA